MQEEGVIKFALEFNAAAPVSPASRNSTPGAGSSGDWD